MVFVVGWVIVLLLLAMWSALTWAGTALVAGLLSQAGAIGSGDWALPEALTAWLPVPAAEWLVGTLETLTPQLQALTGALPSLSGGATVLGWVVWGLGAALLLLTGVLIHVAVALWRKSAKSTLHRAPLRA